MPIMLVMIPRVVRNYIAKFPETWHNAYDYFNYDNRVVCERVPRGDVHRVYQGPNDFSNADYDALVCYAKNLINPILVKYSSQVACEDALTVAIRSFANGLFDGKVNANKYRVLLQEMMTPGLMAAKKKKKAPEAPQVVRPSVVRQLGLTPGGLPLRQRVRERLQVGPSLVRERGKPTLIGING